MARVYTPALRHREHRHEEKEAGDEILMGPRHRVGGIRLHSRASLVRNVFYLYIFMRRGIQSYNGAGVA